MAGEDVPLRRKNRARATWGLGSYLQDPPSRFPVSDPLWPAFEAWVRTGGVVRKTLLEESKNGAWEIIWDIFKAGNGVGDG